MFCAARGMLAGAAAAKAANAPPAKRAANATILELWMSRFTKIPSYSEDWRRLLALGQASTLCS
jgi:hypothetical protein